MTAPHLQPPDVVLSEDAAEDLALQHEQATGHSTTTVHQSAVIACDDCDYLLALSR